MLVVIVMVVGRVKLGKMVGIILLVLMMRTIGCSVCIVVVVVRHMTTSRTKHVKNLLSRRVSAN